MSINSASDVSPAKFLTGAVQAFATLSQSSRSDCDPKIAILAPRSFATRLAAAAKRSGSHCLAVPYAAPGLTPTTLSPRPSARKRSQPGAPSGRRAFQSNHFRFRKLFENPGASQQFQIIEPLMPRDFAGFRNIDGLGQQQAAAIACVADALWNAGGKRDRGGLESILQQDRAVEIFRAQRTPGLPLLGEILRRVRNHAVAERLAPVEVRHPGLGQDGDFCGGKFLVKRAQGGQRHHRVAHPVGGAHQDLAIGHLLTSVVRHPESTLNKVLNADVAYAPGVPRRHSCRCLAYCVFRARDGRREESRRGTHECVRHIMGKFSDAHQ